VCVVIGSSLVVRSCEKEYFPVHGQHDALAADAKRKRVVEAKPDLEEGHDDDELDCHDLEESRHGSGIVRNRGARAVLSR